MFIISLFVIVIFLYFYFRHNNNKNNNDNDKDKDKNTNENGAEGENEIKNKNKNKDKDKNKKEKEKKNSKNIKNILKNIIISKKQKPKIKEDLVYFDVVIDKKNIGKIVIKLYSNIVPNTCYNFKSLCENKSYRNTPFHRIIHDFMIQGGDFTNRNGTGGISIWGNKFDDENFDIPHDQPYLVSMANSGPNTNGSQFFITTGEASHLDGKHVVFGKVVKGFDIVDHLNEIETNNNDKPINDVTISDCGIVKE